MRHLSSREVRLYVAGHLQAVKDGLQARVNLVDGSESVITEFRHWFQPEVANQDMIVIMVEQLAEEVKYQNVFPPTSTTDYILNIWAVGQIENDRIRDDVFSELGTAIKEVLNSRHVATPIEGGKWLYFKDPPVIGVRFGAPNFGTAKTGAVYCMFRGKCDIVDEDPRPNPADLTYWVP